MSDYSALSEDSWAAFEDPAEEQGFVIAQKAVLMNRDLSAAARTLYFILRGYAFQDNKCFPGVKTLCLDMGISDRSEDTLRKWVVELEEAKLIKRVKRDRNAGKYRTNLYVFLRIPAPTNTSANVSATNTSANVSTNTLSDVSNKNQREESSRVDDKPSAPKPKKINYFTLLCDRYNEAGIPIAPEDRDQTSKHLKDLQRLYKATDDEMRRVVLHMTGRRIAGYEISPQRALGDLRGTPLVETKRNEKAEGSAACVIERLKSHPKLYVYAPVATLWDFTREDEPEFKILARLGGNDQERYQNLTMMRSVARRAVREAV